MDKYYIYRPLLDLLGKSEGTDKGRGYNETLAYGAYTGGNVNLCALTLDEIDRLQTSMLAHPKNKWNSSAVGRYQIVRTTLRDIRETLKLSGTALFNEGMQDRMGCFLLGKRGIDMWLAGKISTDIMLIHLAQEWASLPVPSGMGYYDTQNAAVSPQRVIDTLEIVRSRWVRRDETMPDPASQPEEPPVSWWQRFRRLVLWPFAWL